LLDDVRGNHADLLAAIRDEAEISEDSEAKLVEIMDGHTKSFTT
jgi:hypothetical protein